ncbi:MAG: twin-arginine translocase TatA/TatE family subunit [Bacteroidales bacterium]|nr:twin-arginine translocase TatA/TatE family subunit [Bacteroidales bacterium]
MMNNILLFFDISTGEIFIVLVVGFLIFGPKKIPEIARKVGKGMGEIKRATNDIKKEIQDEMNKIENSVRIEEKKIKSNNKESSGYEKVKHIEKYPPEPPEKE